MPTRTGAPGPGRSISAADACSGEAAAVSHGLGGGGRTVVVPGHVGGERRHRMQAERRLGNQPQCPERPGEQLPDVVAGHVLDDLPAGMGHPAVGAHDGDPDQQVARRTVAQPQRAGRAGGDYPADRRRRRAVQREPLSLFGEYLAELPQGDARLGPHYQVTGRVLEDAVHPGHVRDHIAARRRRCPRDRPPAAARHDGHAEGGGGAYHPRGLFHRAGVGHAGGRDPGHRVRGTGLADDRARPGERHGNLRTRGHSPTRARSAVSKHSCATASAAAFTRAGAFTCIPLHVKAPLRVTEGGAAATIRRGPLRRRRRRRRRRRGAARGGRRGPPRTAAASGTPCPGCTGCAG